MAHKVFRRLSLIGVGVNPRIVLLSNCRRYADRMPLPWRLPDRDDGAITRQYRLTSTNEVLGAPLRARPMKAGCSGRGSSYGDLMKRGGRRFEHTQAGSASYSEAMPCIFLLLMGQPLGP